MRGDRLENILLHLIDEGIDTGPIIYNDVYVIPINLNSPEEIEEDYKNRLKEFSINLIKDYQKKLEIFKFNINRIQYHLISQG